MYVYRCANNYCFAPANHAIIQLVADYYVLVFAAAKAHMPDEWQK